MLQREENLIKMDGQQANKTDPRAGDKLEVMENQEANYTTAGDSARKGTIQGAGLHALLAAPAPWIAAPLSWPPRSPRAVKAEVGWPGLCHYVSP
ncbi:unnamed protein product [Boreogadus saida]